MCCFAAVSPALAYVDSLATNKTLVHKKTIREGLSPKSVVYSGNGLFFAQNMMYRHTVTVYNRDFELVKTIKDQITPHDYGIEQYGESKYRGAPVEVASGVTIPSGVSHSVVANAKLGPRALIKGVGLLANYVVKGSAVVADCGEISCGPGCTFGNGQELPLCIETGGREVMSFSELTVAVAAKIARCRGDKDLLEAYDAAVDEYVKAVTSDFGVLDDGRI